MAKGVDGNRYLEHPIAYSIDGAPVYFGGAPDSPERTERGLDGFSTPDDLDVCNAILVDGTWIYYTTETIPYVGVCHHTPSIDNANYNVPVLRAQSERSKKCWRKWADRGRLGLGLSPVKAIVGLHGDEPMLGIEGHDAARGERLGLSKRAATGGVG